MRIYIDHIQNRREEGNLANICKTNIDSLINLGNPDIERKCLTTHDQQYKQ